MTQVAINGQAVTVVEYAGQRVVTLGMVDALHQRPEGTARKRYNDNKRHFIEDEDYFVRNSDEARKLGFTAPNGLTLLTESGYAMLAKSFTDDLAWTVQRQLVRSYFGATPQQPTLSDRQSKAIAVLRAAEEEAAAFIRKRVNDAVLIMQGHDDLVTVPQMPPKLTPKALREAVGMFRSLQYINKLSGMDKNNALLSANRQVRDATGIDLLKNSGATHLLANTTDHPLTPTAIGKRLGEYGAQRINGVLAHLGLQTKKSVGSKEAWVPTTKGEPFAIMEDTSKKSGDGTPIRQLKWRASVIELVRGELSSPVAA